MQALALKNAGRGRGGSEQQGEGMGRKPIGHKAMEPAERIREMRARQWERINTVSDTEWTEADCLLALGSSKIPAGSPLDKAAWQQLGRLRGYL